MFSNELRTFLAKIYIDFDYCLPREKICSTFTKNFIYPLGQMKHNNVSFGIGSACTLS